MTGNRNHLIARSPFYRMNGHFIRSKSTQNQIIKGIEDKLGLEVTDDLLTQMWFIYRAWMLHPFQADDEPGHKTRRVYAEGVEEALINLMKKTFKDSLFNKKTNSRIETEHHSIALQM